ncbi:hypothetical protein BJ170DRAFT_189573 [Xylariales sp. AK1849]|nr:hypothetical protein BJ170DRAFT_189573 [Xylariales sp. AK1849]
MALSSISWWVASVVTYDAGMGAFRWRCEGLRVYRLGEALGEKLGYRRDQRGESSCTDYRQLACTASYHRETRIDGRELSGIIWTVLKLVIRGNGNCPCRYRRVWPWLPGRENDEKVQRPGGIIIQTPHSGKCNAQWDRISHLFLLTEPPCQMNVTFQFGQRNWILAIVIFVSHCGTTMKMTLFASNGRQAFVPHSRKPLHPRRSETPVMYA